MKMSYTSFEKIKQDQKKYSAQYAALTKFNKLKTQKEKEEFQIKNELRGYGIFNEKQIDLIYEKAYEEGHLIGYQEVLNHAYEYADFIIKIEACK